MNILHLLSQKELTGAEVYASTLIDMQKDHQVYQVSNGFFRKNSALQIPLPVETTSIKQFWTSVLSLRKLIKEKDIHVIHAHSRAASKMAFYARWGLKVGLVSSVHGRQHVSFSKKFFNQYGDFIIPVCEKIAQQLSSEFKYSPRRIQTIPNPLDPEKWTFQKARSISNQDILKIAVIGRASGPKKNRTELFVKHFSQILDQKGLRYSINLVGATSPVEINSHDLHQFDLVCGSGRVAMESLASGIPCIAFGEVQYLGLLTEKNFLDGLASNFGDVGENFNLPQFNATQANKDIDLWLSETVNYAKLSTQAHKIFSLATISSRILRLYESAYFLRNYKFWIPILMYHKIPNQDLNSRHKIYVNKPNFEKHLQFFKSNGLTPMTFPELALYRKGLKDWKNFPQKPLILTFDDGYVDNLINADQLLKKYNMSAQIYLLADPNINSNVWDYQDDIQEKSEIVPASDRHLWKKTQFIIGSHGFRHDRLPSMSSDQKNNELSGSKIALEKEFSTPIISYAFAYGDTDADCARRAQEAGYDYAVNTDSGGLLLEEDPYAIFRVNIFPDETISSLWKKTRKWYRRYYFFKRKK